MTFEVAIHAAKLSDSDSARIAQSASSSMCLHVIPDAPSFLASASKLRAPNFFSRQVELVHHKGLSSLEIKVPSSLSLFIHHTDD